MQHGVREENVKPSKLMAEKRRPLCGRGSHAQRSLSLTKRRRAGEAGDGGPRAPTISTFFSNAPPSKLACPLCGELVPRFQINQHIDTQCHNFHKQDESECTQPPSQETRTPEAPLSPSRRTPDKHTGATSPAQSMELQTSPYFKKQQSHVQQEADGGQVTDQPKVVRKVSLGSLSSKLTRRALTFSEQSKTRQTSGAAETDRDGAHLNASQKENQSSVSREAEGRPVDPCDLFSQKQEVCESPDLAEEQEAAAGAVRLCALHTPPDERYKSSVLKRHSRGNTGGNSLSSLKKARLQRDLEKAQTHTSPWRTHTHTSPQHTHTHTNPRLLSPSALVEKPAAGRHGEQSSQSPNRREAGVSQSELMESSTDAAHYTERWPAEASVDAAHARVGSPGEASVDAAHATAETPALFRRPYYLRNFLSVLGSVLEHEDDRLLFNQEDLAVIHSFQQLSGPGQMLYVRLFQRKLKWLQAERLDYAEISADLGPVLDELLKARLLQDESALQDLSEALEILPAPELRSLAKTLHLSGSSSTGHKQQLVEGLLRLSRQRALFPSARGNSTTGAVILKRARQLAGRCVRLCVCGRAVFSRLLLLFSLADSLDEEASAAGGGQGQLYTILLVNSGQLTFPQYTVQRHARVFRHRDELIRYEVAVRCLQEVTAAMQAGSWEDARGLYMVAKATWQELQQGEDLRHEEELPVFLRSFTVGWTYTRIMSRGVEILQRLRCYEEAVLELRSLLAQSVYCVDSRGRWWDRLALNLQQHLKLHEQAIGAIRAGLSDPLVRTGHQLALHQRAARMKESPSLKKFRLLLRDLPTIHVRDVPHVTIRGHMFPHQGGMGKSVFLRPTNQEEGEEGGATVMCSVEDLALAHYRQLGYDQGLHGEGSTFSTLFALLMWDIIFMEGVPDVFRYPYQTCPLDLHTDCFYGNRREAIEGRVQLLRQASVESIQELLAETWQQQRGRVCVLVNWERFSSLQQAQSLVRCMGGSFLAAVVQRMARDYRHCRGGLPDLVVWSSTSGSYKLVEVKGPNDRLSQKQQIWLDELRKWGANVEVCHVTATGARGARLD